jgi:hypothetical protein
MPDVWNSGGIREPQEIMARLLKGKAYETIVRTSQGSFQLF